MAASDHKSMNRTLLSTAGLLVAGILFFAVNVFSNMAIQTVRVDLTENKLYTLSTGTRNILASLSEPVTLRFYLSKKLVTNLPGLSTYATRVEELLDEYRRAANGNIRLQIIDPEPFSEEEDRAVAYGLQGVPLDDSGSTMFYFGLVGTNAVDDEQVIAFFQPDRANQLEYDLTKLVYQLANPKPPVIGLMSSLPLEGMSEPSFFQAAAAAPWVVIEQLRQLFDVREIALDTNSIPDDIDVLMLVHPKDLDPSVLYAIDQFVLAGGRALVFVDPYAEADEPAGGNPMLAMQAPRDSDLPGLFAAWGVSLTKDYVIGDLQSAKKVQFNRGPRPVVVDYPVWMDLSRQNMDGDDIVTANLGNLTVATAGALQASDGATTTFFPLLHSGPQAMKITTESIGMFANPQDLVRRFTPQGQFTIAARVTGPVQSAFPDGAPAIEETAGDAAKAHLSESQQDINVIIVADTDILQDRFWVQVQNFLGQRIAIPTAANGSFVISALDNLTGSNDLISVRNRGNFDRPFLKIKELQQSAEQQFLEKEKQLQDQLRETEQKLNELQRKDDTGNSLILSPEQQAEIERFRQQKIQIRKDLRDVQHELNKNIERLEDWMKFMNIWLVPLVIGIGGIGLSIYRMRRRRSAQVSSFKTATEANV